MAALSHGLGKGLDALLNSSAMDRSEPESATAQEQDIKYLDLSLIQANPQQPRRRFDEQGLEELAQSIAENGVLQPILVRVRGQGYEIIAGERRWRASRQAGLTQVPALVRELSDKEALVVALLENLQREDLNPLEEAQALERLQQEMDLSQGELAKHVCKSRPAVANSLRLLQLDTEIRQAVLDGQLSAGNARTIMGVSQKEARLSLFALVCKKGLSVRETEKAVAYYKEHGRLPAAYAPKGAAQPQSDPFLDQLRQALARQLPSKVQLLGTRDKGRISFRYESPEQLEQLLEALGAKIDLDVSRETP